MTWEVFGFSVKTFDPFSLSGCFSVLKLWTLDFLVWKMSEFFLAPKLFFLFSSRATLKFLDSECDLFNCRLFAVMLFLENLWLSSTFLSFGYSSEKSWVKVCINFFHYLTNPFEKATKLEGKCAYFLLHLSSKRPENW